MLNFEALFKITYGLYVVSSGNQSYGNGYISNTVFQVTAEPPKFATCCNKNNHTHGLIDKSGAFSVSVLRQEAGAELIGKLGYKSGKDEDKFIGLNIYYGTTGVPVVLDDSIAFLECSVVEKFDVGTHTIFIGELLDAQIIDDTREPLTYLYYRQIKKGLAPKNAPTYVDKSKLSTKPAAVSGGKHKCTACGYIYDDNVEKIKFSDLSDEWKCPLCSADKEDFIDV